MAFHLTSHGSVTLVTLDAPPANALDHAFLRELVGLLPQLAAARAVVLTGTGRFFSAGLDLTKVFTYPEPEARAFATTFDDVMLGLFALDTPVVAAINGHAVAGGCVLAACCDWRIVSDQDLWVGLTEIQVGVPFPTSAREIMRASAASPRLYEVFQRGLKYRPVDALACRLVDEIVPHDQVLARALATAEEFASRPRVAFATTKRAMRKEALERSASARRGADGFDPIWLSWRSPEVIAAMIAFRNQALGKKSS